MLEIGLFYFMWWFGSLCITCVISFVHTCKCSSMCMCVWMCVCVGVHVPMSTVKIEKGVSEM